ncbi:MAG: hypothetical protein EXR50_05245 [Dehalococcoidia bacterium]|nr:hypothetical protein [Dehalococcoidia bacterium]
MIEAPGTAEQERHVRRYRRVEKEKRKTKAAWFLSFVLGIVLLAVPVYGYYDVFVAPSRQPVVRVNDRVFTMGDYMERLRINGRSHQLSGEGFDLALEPFKLLDTIQQEELIRQSAGRYNISASNEEVDGSMRERFLPPPEERGGSSPEELESTFQGRYRQFLNELKLPDKDYRQTVSAGILREKLKDKLSDRVPAVTEQAHVFGIHVDDYNAAAEVKTQLDGGVNFGVLARTKSKDSESSKADGDMGWLPKKVMGPQFDETAFNIPIGQLSDPISLPGGAWLIRVVEKADARKVEGKALQLLRDKAVDDWFQEESKANVVERYFDSTKYETAVKKLKEYERPTAAPQQGGQG